MTGFTGNGKELVTIKLENYASVKDGLAKLDAACQQMGKYQAVVGSHRPYAFGVEEGYHEVSGGLARRAGGAQYLQGAVNTVLASADQDIQAGLDRARQPGAWIMSRLARWVRRVARANVPRETGQLRRSIIYEIRKQ